MLYGLFISLRNSPIPNLQPNSPPTTDHQPQFTGHWLLITFVSVYTLIHLLSWALIRYRLPVDGVMLIFAGVALVDLVERFRAWRCKRTV